MQGQKNKTSPEGAPEIDALVVGAGLTGLACGLELNRAGREFVVVEAAPHPGGVVQTSQQDGFLFEEGPHTVPGSARNLRECAALAGVAERLVVSSTDANRRYLFKRGALRALPSGPFSFLTSGVLSAGAKLRILTEPLRRMKPVAAREGELELEEPTLEAFLSERIGREATRTLAGAFVRGVYGAEIDQLGVASAFPRLWQGAQAGGGLLRGMARGLRARREALESAGPAPGPDTGRGGLLSFPGGLSELTRAMGATLGDELHCASPVRSLEPAADGRVLVRAGEHAWAARHVILTTPPTVVADLVQDFGVGRETLQPLREVERSFLCYVQLGLTPLDDATPIELPRGFGYLVPPDEAWAEGRTGPLGTLFPHNIFEGRTPEGGAIAVVIYPAEVAGERTDESAAALARMDLEHALGRELRANVATHHVVRDLGIPRYGVGHAARMERTAEALREVAPAFRLAGNWIGGVSVEDCLGRGRQVARDCAAP